jgi:hypothetical protein
MKSYALEAQMTRFSCSTLALIAHVTSHSTQNTGPFSYTGVGIVRILKRPHGYRSRVRIQQRRRYLRQLTQLAFPQVIAILCGSVDSHLQFHEPWSTQPTQERPLTGISAGQGPFLQRGG